MRISTNWLKDYLDIRIPIEAVVEKLTMVGLEVTSLIKMDQDIIMEIEVTPNRADCLSVIGIARELAASTGKKLKLPKIPALRGKSSLRIPIHIHDPKLCPRYIGRVIKNISVEPSPEWLVQRLEAMGVRSVNNIVDITNFCMLEFGQPLHAFDLDKLQGQRINIRRALPAEQIVTLDGITRELDATMLVIADKIQPQAIAGVMGAGFSEVSQETTSILLESAYFNPLNIHHTSRKLGLATQSSYRFERGVDLAAVYLCSLRAADLIKRLSRSHKKKVAAGSGRPGKKAKPLLAGALVDKGLKAWPKTKVKLRFAQLNQLLGTQISVAQIKEIMHRLGFSLLRRSKDALSVEIPSFRPDVTREADLIEEASRLHGYDRIPVKLTQLAPDLSFAGGLELSSAKAYNMIRQILSALGFNEMVSFSLISRQGLRKLELPLENTLTVKNPLSYTQEILRPTLIVSVLNTVLTNINRGNKDLKLFELSRVYTKTSSNKSQELNNLCLAITGKRGDNWLVKSGEFSFFDLKGVLEVLLQKLGVENFCFVEEEQALFTPGRSAKLVVQGQDLGYLGELRADIVRKFDLGSQLYIGEFAVHRLLTNICPAKKFAPLAKFPAVERDISLIAPLSVQSEQIMALIQKIGHDLVAKVRLFDQYCGEQIPAGFRGLAYSIEYRSLERTLTAEEVDKLHAQVRQALSAELKLQLR